MAKAWRKSLRRQGFKRSFSSTWNGLIRSYIMASGLNFDPSRLEFGGLLDWVGEESSMEQLHCLIAFLFQVSGRNRTFNCTKSASTTPCLASMIGPGCWERFKFWLLRLILYSLWVPWCGSHLQKIFLQKPNQNLDTWHFWNLTALEADTYKHTYVHTYFKFRYIYIYIHK